jgi:hypothetical protein
MLITRKSPIRRVGANSSGQAAVEFMFVVIFLMILTISMIELIMLIYAYSVVADAAKEGVRYAVVHGNTGGLPSGPTCPCNDIDGPPAPSGTPPGYGSGFGVVRTFAQYSLHDVTGTHMNVTVTYPDTANAPANKPPNRVRVQVTYPYAPFFGLGWPSVTLYSAAEGRIMY